MLGKFKQILGIDGVKVSIVIPESIEDGEGVINGKVILTTKKKQKVNSILIQVIERFSRGKKAEKRIDEYVIGKLFLEGPITINANERVEKDFTLNYTVARSEMDQLEGQNFFFKGLVKIAKLINKVKSEFRIEVEVDVNGTPLNPIIKEELFLK